MPLRFLLGSRQHSEGDRGHLWCKEQAWDAGGVCQSWVAAYSFVKFIIRSHSASNAPLLLPAYDFCFSPHSACLSPVPQTRALPTGCNIAIETEKVSEFQRLDPRRSTEWLIGDFFHAADHKFPRLLESSFDPGGNTRTSFSYCQKDQHQTGKTQERPVVWKGLKSLSLVLNDNVKSPSCCPPEHILLPIRKQQTGRRSDNVKSCITFTVRRIISFIKGLWQFYSST